MTRGRPRDDDDDDDRDDGDWLDPLADDAIGGNVIERLEGDEATAEELARRNAAKPWADEAPGPDAAAEARAIARGQAADAMRIMVAIMREPRRRSGVQLAACSKVLEVAGIGSGSEEIERRTLARVIELARAKMDAGALRQLAAVLAELSGRQPVAPALGAGAPTGGPQARVGQGAPGRTVHVQRPPNVDAADAPPMTRRASARRRPEEK